MKKTITLLLVLAMCLSLCACGGKKIELGDTVKKGILQATLKDVQMADTNFVIANKNSDDFLSPIAKDDLQLGDRFIRSTDKNDAPIVITMIVENVGKKDLSINPSDYVINYDNGNIYRADTCYAKVENIGWSEFNDFSNQLTLEKVTSGAVEIRMCVWVPNVIINSTESLTLEFHGFTYVIR